MINYKTPAQYIDESNSSNSQDQYKTCTKCGCTQREEDFPTEGSVCNFCLAAESERGIQYGE